MKTIKLLSILTTGAIATAPLISSCSVSEESVVEIAVTKLPTHAFYAGEELNLDGLEITALMKNGGTRLLEKNEYTCSLAGKKLETGKNKIIFTHNQSKQRARIYINVYEKLVYSNDCQTYTLPECLPDEGTTDLKNKEMKKGIQRFAVDSLPSEYKCILFEIPEMTKYEKKPTKFDPHGWKVYLNNEDDSHNWRWEFVGGGYNRCFILRSSNIPDKSSVSFEITLNADGNYCPMFSPQDWMSLQHNKQ